MIRAFRFHKERKYRKKFVHEDQHQREFCFTRMVKPRQTTIYAECGIKSVAKLLLNILLDAPSSSSDGRPTVLTGQVSALFFFISFRNFVAKPT
jgi:hypothetical protein